jgi:ATP-dependent DNA ligase
VRVCIFAFDMLYFNGESLVRMPFRQRRQILIDNFPASAGQFQLATSMCTSDTDEIQSFLDEAVKGFLYFVFAFYMVSRKLRRTYGENIGYGCDV